MTCFGNSLATSIAYRPDDGRRWSRLPSRSVTAGGVAGCSGLPNASACLANVANVGLHHLNRNNVASRRALKSVAREDSLVRAHPLAS